MPQTDHDLAPGFPGNADIVALTDWRHELHRHPELSGQEAATAQRVTDMLAPTNPDRVLTGLGGHGVAAVYEGTEDGPAILLRCELDALPIEELGDRPYRSEVPGKGHLCGHDGHMAILAGVARWLAANRPLRGRVILLFQPAEEDGSGAARVIADPRFADIKPDYALSLHNMPGLPLGHAALETGPMACASRGMRITLTGRTAHASQPETGVSPVAAMSRLMPLLTGLGRGGAPADPDFSLATVTHARIGEPAFGVAPGQAELWVTLRTQSDAKMAALVAQAEAAVVEAAAADGLTHSVDYHDVFRDCVNDAEAVELMAAALRAENIPLEPGRLPMRASEDFGRFGDHAKSAMMLLGSGTGCAALHNPDYDFPDSLIAVGARIFVQCLRQRLY
ncbi:amidohydrolase [Thalassovita mangrovi]|uniref:Amidohydrolase n=1 Tax=Thalassovita mangrovi TaxID=2692236 RepID=A0A6L8LRV2_9RHOB|nr:amidohydrolase [Thalassovita mangrovi]MYM56202.1 amidohydrolase [Thalassovita mangrovi]